MPYDPSWDLTIGNRPWAGFRLLKKGKGVIHVEGHKGSRRNGNGKKSTCTRPRQIGQVYRVEWSEKQKTHTRR